MTNSSVRRQKHAVGTLSVLRILKACDARDLAIAAGWANRKLCSNSRCGVLIAPWRGWPRAARIAVPGLRTAVQKWGFFV